MAEIVLMTEEQKQQLQQAFIYTASRLKDYFDGLQVVMRQWFPVVSQIHRAEVKRVRTAYRKKKGKRW